MIRLIRPSAAVVFGSSLLFAQIPNPLNLPDPLGLSKKPEPSRSAPPSPREGRRAERKPRPEKHRDQGRHKGEEKRENRKRGEHKGHDKR